MFTGIVQSIGTVTSVTKKKGGVECTIAVPLRRRWKKGESVLVDGVCSTLTHARGRTLTFSYMEETCAKTTVCGYGSGTRVNIEPSLRVGDDLSGHVLSGHVDGRGAIRSIAKKGMMTRIAIRVPAAIAAMMIEKGSVAVDGISLTIVSVSKTVISLACIPYTLAHTTLGLKKSGDSVNIEVDMMAKYAKRIIAKKIA